MRTRFGHVEATTVDMGARVVARLLMGAVILAIYLIQVVGTFAILSDGYGYETLDRLNSLTTVILLLCGAYAVTQLVLNFAKSTSVGGKLCRYHFIKADTGEPAKATVFLKYMVEGLFEIVTLGIGMISYFVSYRDGQHWLDRSFNIVAVKSSTVRPVGERPQLRATEPTPAGPRVMPVRMPQPPAGTGAPRAATPTTPGALPPGLSVSGTPGGAITPGPYPKLQPSQPAGTNAPTRQPPGSRPAPTPVSGAPTTGAPRNPWALSPAGSGSAAPPTSSPAPVSSSARSFAPPGQAPLPRVTAPPAPPAASTPSPSPSLLSDETVIDPEVLAESALAIVLDDGQRIVIDGPVVIGRNPIAPQAYPSARAVQAVDESMRLSKTHVVVVPAERGVSVYDVGATNGVHIEADGNKNRVTAHELHPVPPGAVVHFGGRSLRVAQ